MIEGVLDMETTQVKEVMKPRVDVVGIDASCTVSELFGLIQSTKYSRIPVYDSTRGPALARRACSRPLWPCSRAGAPAELCRRCLTAPRAAPPFPPLPRLRCPLVLPALRACVPAATIDNIIGVARAQSLLAYAQEAAKGSDGSDLHLLKVSAVMEETDYIPQTMAVMSALKASAPPTAADRARALGRRLRPRCSAAARCRRLASA